MSAHCIAVSSAMTTKPCLQFKLGIVNYVKILAISFCYKGPTNNKINFKKQPFEHNLWKKIESKTCTNFTPNCR